MEALKRAAIALGVAAGGASSAGAADAASAPRVEELVVSPKGGARQVTVTDGQTTVRAVALERGNTSERCAVPAGSALAALARAGAGTLTVWDYGSCSATNPADAGNLFVEAIGRVANRSANGWEYKVGTRAATDGAANPAGPFGNGRIHAGARLTWFYCYMNVHTGGCQPTLALSWRAIGGGKIAVTVRAYDNRGHGRAVHGATVHAGHQYKRTDRGGHATLKPGPGTVSIYAQANGDVRSFAARVNVR